MTLINKNYFFLKRQKRFALNYKLKFTYRRNNFFLNFIFNNILIKRKSYGFIVDNNYYQNIISWISYMYNKKKKKKNLNFFIFEIEGLVRSRRKILKKSIKEFLKDVVYKKGFLSLQTKNHWSFNGCRLKSKIRKTRHKRKRYGYTWRNYFFKFRI